jgi:hypothetical protein
MILVELKGKDLLRELNAAYAENEVIMTSCKSVLDCIESAEALSRVRHLRALRCFFCTGRRRCSFCVRVLCVFG